MAYEEIPRGPIQNEKSGSWDYTDGYDMKIRAWRESAREEARRMHKLNIEANEVAKYIQHIQGQHWPESARRWRSKFVDNRINKARFDHLAALTDTRPVIDVSTQNDAYTDIAQVIDKVIRYEWENCNMDLSLITVADITDAYGTGFWRLGAAKPGITKVTPCGPDQVMPIQPGFDIQDSTAVMYRTWKAVQWLKRKFPFTSAGIEREAMYSPLAGATGGEQSFARPSHIDEYTWNGLSQAMKRSLGTKSGPSAGLIDHYFASIETEEFFIDDPSTNDSTRTITVADPYIPQDSHNWWYTVAPRMPLFPRKRHIVFAGNGRPLADGPSPYWHGLYPFATLRFNPVFWSFWGLSKYRDLIPINSAMNQIVAGGLNLIERALNPTAITKDGGVPPAVWKEFYPDMPGSKLRVDRNTPLNEAIRYIDPPVIPGYVFEMLKGWLAPEFDRMSGQLDVNALSSKLQPPGGDTLEQMRDSQNTGARLEERQLEIFLRDSGRQSCSNVLQFYTAKQRMKMLGSNGLVAMDFNLDLGSMLPEEAKNQPDFWKNFGFSLATGSLHSGAKDRTKQVAMSLAARHQLPLIELYRVLELPNGQALLEQLVQEAHMMAGANPGPGRQTSDKMTRGQRNGKPA